MSGIPYLGSKISLISKSEIRYEGILVDVNPQDSTITFEQVRFFGTEGRRPGDEIAPMDKVFDCVVFRSADIKDLQVYETPKEEKKQEPEFPDPAVVSFNTSSSSKSGPSGFQYQSSSSSSANTSSSKNEEVKMPKVNDYASAASSTAFESSNQNTKSFSTRNRSTSYQYNNNNNTSRNNPRGIVVPKSEFDFRQSNAKFSKEEIAINESTSVEESTIPSYNKNLSFFDDISCQANTESSRQPDRNRNERNLNMETFGQSAPPRRYHRGGRGRGGYYRGGSNRGGYGYNSTNNNSNSNRDQS